MKKTILLIILSLSLCGCTSLNGMFGNGVRDTIDGVTKKWVLTSMNGIPAKFNMATGEMWLLGSDGWMRIDDDYSQRVGAKHIIMRVSPSLPDLERK